MRSKVDTNNEYLDAAPEMFSAAIQAMVEEERQIYELLKAQKAKLLAAIQAEMPVAAGREVKRTAYTAWGQWQIVVGDKIAPKANSAKRSLAEYLASQGANGHAV
jgi:hypothetical protein